MTRIFLIVAAVLAFGPPAFADGGADPCAKYGLSSKAEYEPGTVPIAVNINYYQSSYKPVDPVGDYALVRSARLTPRQIWWVVARKPETLATFRRERLEAEECARALYSAPPASPLVYEGAEPFVPREEDLEAIERLSIPPAKKKELSDRLRAGQLAIEGHRNPFDVDRMKNMFQEILVEEARDCGLVPSRSKAGDWSPAYLDRVGLKGLPYTAMPKLLVALARGETDQYFRTNTQDDLERWILAQPERSVTIDSLFRASYRLSRGDVYLALLSIENVLARDWHVADRESLAVSRRLADITNHFGLLDNHFGTWYHLFGIMLYGVTSGSAPAWTIGLTERVGSTIMKHGAGDARQESYANLKGGLLGGQLRRLVDSGSWKTAPSDPRLADPSYYLRLDEDFGPRLEKLAR